MELIVIGLLIFFGLKFIIKLGVICYSTGYLLVYLLVLLMFLSLVFIDRIPLKKIRGLIRILIIICIIVLTQVLLNVTHNGLLVFGLLLFVCWLIFQSAKISIKILKIFVRIVLFMFLLQFSGLLVISVLEWFGNLFLQM